MFRSICFLEPAGLRQLMGGIRKIEFSLGDGVKKFIEEEKKVAQKLREHLQKDPNH